jgi:hypothetical protein
LNYITVTHRGNLFDGGLVRLRKVSATLGMADFEDSAVDEAERGWYHIHRVMAWDWCLETFLCAEKCRSRLEADISSVLDKELGRGNEKRLVSNDCELQSFGGGMMPCRGSSNNFSSQAIGDG